MDDFSFPQEIEAFRTYGFMNLNMPRGGDRHPHDGLRKELILQNGLINPFLHLPLGHNLYLMLCKYASEPLYRLQYMGGSSMYDEADRLKDYTELTLNSQGWVSLKELHLRFLKK
jgi:hypothetical protein